MIKKGNLIHKGINKNNIIINKSGDINDNSPSSGGAGQPRVRLKTVKNNDEQIQEYIDLNPAETESTGKQRDRKPEKRGIRSENATNEKKIKRSSKRQISRKNKRKTNRGVLPLESDILGNTANTSNGNNNNIPENQQKNTTQTFK